MNEERMNSRTKPDLGVDEVLEHVFVPEEAIVCPLPEGSGRVEGLLALDAVRYISIRTVVERLRVVEHLSKLLIIFIECSDV